MVLGFAALLAIGFFFPWSWWHWRAEWALRDGDLDLALARDPDHPEARIARSRPEDLDRLIRLEPHHAGAHYNRTRTLPPDDAIAALRAIHREHDPHHVLTSVRLAQLLRTTEPLAAIELLEQAIRVDPVRVEPYGMLARLYRENGEREFAQKYLRLAERRGYTRDVARERLRFEIEELRDGRWNKTTLVEAMRHLPVDEARAPIVDALRAARAIESASSPPHVALEPDEDAVAYGLRVAKERRAWRDGIAEKTWPLYRLALVLADALCAVAPAPQHVRYVRDAAKGLGDDARAAQAEEMAQRLEEEAAHRRGG
jgi:hypothetical protein